MIFMKKIIKKIYLKNKFNNLKIGKNSNLSLNCYFEGSNVIGSNCDLESISIGFGTYIGNQVQISNSKIGKYCSLGSNLKIGLGVHPASIFVSTHPAFFSNKKQAGFTFTDKNKFEEHKYINENKNVVEIGNDVWIGDNVIIMDGVKISDGAIIGAGAIVTKNIEPYTINVGIPSKIIKKRFENEEIKFLLNFKWWDKDYEWVQKNYNKFENISIFYKEFNQRR